MNIKTMPLSRLEANLRATLNECADSGQAVVVELPDQRLITIQAMDVAEDDSLVDDLLQSDPAFQELVAKSKAGPRKPFNSRPEK
jgi:c-di-GMP-binding flagellar brake protein YcgR